VTLPAVGRSCWSFEDEPMKVDFREISDAFDFVSFGSMYEHQAFLDKETGKIYYHSEFGDDLEELPEDIDCDRYIGIPHKNDLDLGKDLVLNFAYRYLSENVEEVQAMFSRKGAYSKFKNFLENKGILEEWYDFETKEQEKALRAWCESRSIQITG
jgi:hypothetical protein